MFGDTIDIDKDSKRYNQLLGEGMLPSAAIKKIETEKRLGVGIKPKEDTEWNITLVKIAIVGLILFTGYSILKKKVTSPISPVHSSMAPISIDNIPGIDLNALTICKEKGLM